MARTADRIPARRGETGQVTVADALAEAARVLAADAEAPTLEAEVLLAHVLDSSRARLRAWPERVVDGAALARFRRLVARRRDGVPSAYLTGRREFWSLSFEVNEAVLIPRPETECLVETALALLPADATATIADAGTGCGAIAIALATERPRCRIVASDSSRAALSVARRNVDEIGVANVALVAGYWLAPMAAAGFDLLVSNPPYVAAGDPHLGRGGPAFEPRHALAAGADGLDAIRILIDQGRRCIRPGGRLLLEHGYDQGAAVRRLLTGTGYREVVTGRDYAGLDRVTQGLWPGH